MNETSTYAQAVSEYEAARLALYRSELALHDAQGTGVDRWIAAAADHLHEAVERELKAAAVVAGFSAA
jgi:hypothetical protein